MLPIGTVLCTKDGRCIGNGIILRRDYSAYLGACYLVKTDFGNLVTLTREELNSLFYMDTVVPPQVQLREQLRLLYKNFPPNLG